MIVRYNPGFFNGTTEGRALLQSHLRTVFPQAAKPYRFKRWTSNCVRRRLVGEGGFDGLGDFRGVGGDVGLEAGDGVAVFVEEELGEVPLDFAGEFGVGGVAGEELVKRGLVVAGDGELGHHGEAHVVLFGAEGLDLFVGAGFLAGEVVGGDANDDEAAGLVLLVDGF